MYRKKNTVEYFAVVNIVNLLPNFIQPQHNVVHLLVDNDSNNEANTPSSIITLQDICVVPATKKDVIEKIVEYHM
jgi:hypothetical protein